MKDNYLNDPQKIIEAAMQCKECGANCNLCNFEGTVFCFDEIMWNTCTDDKAEIMVQMYLLGAKQALEKQAEQTKVFVVKDRWSKKDVETFDNQEEALSFIRKEGNKDYYLWFYDKKVT